MDIISEEVYNITDPINDLDEDELLQRLRTEYIEGYYGEFYHAKYLSDFAFCVLGYITNTLNLIVLLNIPKFNSLDLFMVVLSVTDILQITTVFVFVIHYFTGYSWFPSYEYAISRIALFFLESIFLCISGSISAVSCIWRCVAITWPLQSRYLCSMFRAKIAIVTVFITSIILSAPILAGYTYEEEVVNGISVYDVTITMLASSNNFTLDKIVDIFYMLSISGPMLVMLVATIWMGVSLYKIRMERKRILHQKSPPRFDHRITAILTLLLVLNWLTSIPDYLDQFIYSYLNSEKDEALQQKCEKIAHILNLFSVARQSVPFFIYFALGANFRKKFKEIFCKCFVSKDIITSETRTAMTEKTAFKSEVLQT